MQGSCQYVDYPAASVTDEGIEGTGRMIFVTVGETDELREKP